MTPTRKLVLVSTVLVLVAFGLTAWLVRAVADSTAAAVGQVTIGPPPTTGPAVSTTSLVEPSVVTGNGPEAFTTLTVPGPVQVLVVKAECVGYAGDGWWITWKVTNQGQAREGALIAQVDQTGPAPVLVPNLQLAAGQSASARQATGAASGDSIRVTWANADRPVQSGIFGVPTCPTDPKDLADARHATTT
jgi:hypothetical protein